jgi:hypothetical protein
VLQWSVRNEEDMTFQNTVKSVRSAADCADFLVNT